MPENSPLQTFIIYARDDRAYKDQLLRHLRPLVSSDYLRVWHDGDILPGEDWERKIKANLQTSQLVLVLVSVNCLNSDFIESEELAMAVGMLNTGHARIVPIIVSPCGWRYHRLFVGLQGLPEDMKPVSDWPSPDRAWTNVVDSLAKMVEETRAAQIEQDRKQREEEEKKRREEEARKQREEEEKKRRKEQDAAAALAAEREAQQRATQAEREAREQAERTKREQAAQERQAALTAQKAEAERLRREAREHARQQRAASADTAPEGRVRQLTFVAIGVVAVLVVGWMLWPHPPARPPQEQHTATPTESPAVTDPEAADWAKAEADNSLAAYRAYLRDHDQGPHAELAKRRIGDFKEAAQNHLDDAERLLRNGKAAAAKPLLEKILREMDPDNQRAQDLLRRIGE